MKTIIKELIDNIEILIEEEYKDEKLDNGIIVLFQAKILIRDMIEKEKERSLELIRFIRTNDKMGKSVEDLYNEFYNQNK